MVCGFHGNQRDLFKNYSSSECATVPQRNNTYLTISVQLQHFTAAVCRAEKGGLGNKVTKKGTKMQLPALWVDQVRKPLRERIQVFPFHTGVIPCREAQLMGTIVTWSKREEKQHRESNSTKTTNASCCGEPPLLHAPITDSWLQYSPTVGMLQHQSCSIILNK